MKSFPAFRRSYFILILIITLCVCLIQCIERGNRSQAAVDSGDEKFDQFAGSASCQKCHKQIYDSFVLTSHIKTSEPSSEKNILGSFQPGKNIFHYRPGLYVSMEKTDSGLYQVEYVDSVQKKLHVALILLSAREKGGKLIYPGRIIS